METRDVESLWKTYQKLSTHIEGPQEAVHKMLEELGERMIMCSSSLDEEGKGCGPGGFLEVSLSVTSKMRTLSKSLGLDVPQSSIILAGLFHGLGSVGDRNRPYLVEQDSDWHKKKGIHYKYNEALPKSLVSHRSLQLLQEFGVTLNFDEWVAIALSSGPHRDENRFYVGSEPPLAILLTQARQWVFGRNN
jgi:hypothetical protein